MRIAGRKDGFGIARAAAVIAGLLASASGAGSQTLAALPAVTIPAATVGEARPVPAWTEFCARYASECAVDASEPAQVTLTPRLWQTVSGINRQVNTSLRAVTDQEHWGVPDRWDLAEDGSGDCEDFQLLKRKLLAQAGLPRRAMRMTVVIDEKGEGHAVLMLRTTAAISSSTTRPAPCCPGTRPATPSSSARATRAPLGLPRPGRLAGRHRESLRSAPYRAARTSLASSALPLVQGRASTTRTPGAGAGSGPRQRRGDRRRIERRAQRDGHRLPSAPAQQHRRPDRQDERGLGPQPPYGPKHGDHPPVMRRRVVGPSLVSGRPSAGAA